MSIKTVLLSMAFGSLFFVSVSEGAEYSCGALQRDSAEVLGQMRLNSDVPRRTTLRLARGSNAYWFCGFEQGTPDLLVCGFGIGSMDRLVSDDTLAEAKTPIGDVGLSISASIHRNRYAIVCLPILEN